MKQGSPLVSIVTPVYNAQKFLEETIKTVQDQTYQNWEWLLVDDKSSDDSVDIIKQASKHDKRIKLVQLKTNSGAAKARNTGTGVATGQYIAFLDADDIWFSEKLEKQIKFMKDNDYVFTFTGYEFADKEGVSTGKIVTVPKDISYRQSLKNHIISTTTVVVDISKMAKEHLIMPDIRSGQDAATWWQLLRQVDRAYGLNETLSYYRRTGSSLSANKFKAMKRTWYLFRKQEKLGHINSAYHFVWYGYNAARKRL